MNKLEYNKADLEFMKLAMQQAKRCKSEDKRTHPKVGAVAVQKGKLLASAYRGEKSKGDHAEYTLLEKKLKHQTLAKATIYTTLELNFPRSLGQ